MINNLGLIPARGGSKSIPRKNIRPLNGKPLITYTIEAALSSLKLNRLIVSTDDEEIRDVALKYGAEVPFLRPLNLAQDHSGDIEVISHAIKWISDFENDEIENIIYLRPTTPFKTGLIIDDSIRKMEENNFSGLRSVTKVEGIHHPYWMFKDNNSLLKSFVEGVNIAEYYQRQLLPPCYRLNGVVDIMRSLSIQNECLFGDTIGYIEIDELNGIDIDTEMDFKYCEFLMKEFFNG